MGHEVLVTEDGIEHLAIRGIPAWHQLGNPIPEDVRSTVEAAKIAHIDEILTEKQGLFVYRNGVYEPIADKVALVRLPYASEPEPMTLGLVDSSYEPVQNLDFAEYLEPLATKLKIDCVAALWGGSMTFFSFEDTDGLFDILLPNGKKDAMKRYILAVENKKTGHSIKIIDSNWRVVCANTESVAENDALWTIQISHKDGSNKMLKFTARILSELASRQMALKQAFQSMANTPISDDNVKRFINTTWPIGKTPDSVKLGAMHFKDRMDADGLTGDELEFWTKIQKANATYARRNAFALKCREEAQRVYEEEPTQQDIKGTVWGAYNMATFVAEHFQDTPGTSKVKLANIVDGDRYAVKERAYKAAMSLTGDIRWTKDYDWESEPKDSEDDVTEWLDRISKN